MWFGSRCIKGTEESFSIGSFDAPWSKRSSINDLFSDFPKETHPKLTYFFIRPLEMQAYVEETSSSISGCFMNA